MIQCLWYMYKQIISRYILNYYIFLNINNLVSCRILDYIVFFHSLKSLLWIFFVFFPYHFYYTGNWSKSTYYFSLWANFFPKYLAISKISIVVFFKHHDQNSLDSLYYIQLYHYTYLLCLLVFSITNSLSCDYVFYVCPDKGADWLENSTIYFCLHS